MPNFSDLSVRVAFLISDNLSLVLSMITLSPSRLTASLISFELSGVETPFLSENITSSTFSLFVNLRVISSLFVFVFVLFVFV